MKKSLLPNYIGLLLLTLGAGCSAVPDEETAAPSSSEGVDTETEFPTSTVSEASVTATQVFVSTPTMAPVLNTPTEQGTTEVVTPSEAPTINGTWNPGATPTVSLASPTPQATASEVGGATPTPIANQAPLITWLTPTDGAVYGEGETILFEVAVSDDGQNASDILVSFDSSLDGLLAQGQASEDGQFSAGLATLSPGTHDITVLAIDLEGLQSSLVLGVIVNSLACEGSDGDGDGFGSSLECMSLDCNDGDDTIYPGADETCNSQDDDCDEQVDEDAGQPYYLDEDGDGFGVADTEQLFCEAGKGYSMQSGDCEDSNSDIFPGAEEDCNALDDDCDEVVDEGLEVMTWYFDEDGDGFGHSSEMVEACAAPADHVDNSLDCDDQEEAINPDAVELCAESADEDCNGVANCSDESCSDLEACDMTQNCLDGDLGEEVEAPLLSADFSEAEASSISKCGGSTSVDLAYNWMAPNTGRFVITVQADGFSPILSVLLEGCLGEEVACHGAEDGYFSTVTMDVVEGEEFVLVIDGEESAAGGSFDLNIVELNPNDDHGDSAIAATLVGIGESIDGEIEIAGDHDWFAFQPYAGQIVHLGTDDLDTYVYLYGVDGQELIESHDIDDIYYEFDVAGTYFYRVRHYSSTQVGSYVVTLEDLGVDDHQDEASQASLLVDELDGRIETPKDNDWFAFEVYEGEIKHIYTDGVDTFVYLYEQDGETLIESHDTDDVYYEFEEAGTYYYRVRHYSSSQIGDYTVYLESLGVDDHGDGADTASELESSLSGNIETPKDNDWFSFEAYAGEIIHLSTDGVDTFVYLYESDGQTIIESHDVDNIYYEFEEAGTYYYRIRHYSPSSIGSYSVYLESLGEDDHGDSAEFASVIEDTTDAAIETPGDNDWFSFNAYAGEIIHLYTDELDTYVYLYDTDGETLIESHDADDIWYEFDEEGTYYYRVRHYNSSKMGNYSVYLESLGVDDHGDGVVSSSLLSDGLGGDIETPGDNDYFVFYAQSGDDVSLSTDGVDTYVYVYDSDGVTSLYASDSDAVNLSIESSGYYYYRVRHYYSSSRGSYVVNFSVN